MDVDTRSSVCPVCGYEFPRQSGTLKWVAIAIVILFLLYMVFF